MKQISLPKRAAMCVVAGALTASTPALADLSYDNGSGGTALFYGQFNPAWQSFDDGVQSYDDIVDNANSNSRVGFWLRQAYASGTLSFNFETALGFRQSSLVTQGFTPKGINWQRTSIRKVDFSYKSDSWGTISIGQGSVASDGAAEVDLSGTSIVTYSWIAGDAGAFRFRTAAGALTNRAIGAAMPNFDGGRRGRIRYDTPSFGGFSVAVAYGEEVLAQNANFSTTNIALRYSGEVAGWNMQGAVAYADIEPAVLADRQDTIGSFSALHSSGFNATVAFGKRNEQAGAACANGCSYGYAKLGYQADWFAVGKTALSIDYYSSSDTTVAGSDANTVGIGAVQKFDKQRIEAYLGYREYSLAEPGTSYRDSQSVLMGARWKF
ncbi:porin [Seohaeicola saemankumensis]|nr:porin [Seohaeicola saemankumensis]MCA0873683.1 porin [Seohaeicola saemankumensis]